MISKEQLIRIIDKGKEKGAEIKVRDIAFLILCGRFEDKNVVYKTLFGGNATESDVEEYTNDMSLILLKNILKEEKIHIGERKSMSAIDVSKELTFEENKEALVQKLSDIQQALEDGEIEDKDAVKLEIDIRTKLNDKFSVANDSIQQYVVVSPKFNHICEQTGRECWLQTKEFAKEHWKLVEKDKAIEELKKDYDIIPKKK